MQKDDLNMPTSDPMQTQDQAPNGSQTPAFAQSASWGTGGSFVFDPTTGMRMSEEEWSERQNQAKDRLIADTNTSTTKLTKGA